MTDTLTAPAIDRAAAVAALVAAFSSDPILRWVFPDAGRYLSAFPQLIEVMGRDAFQTGTVDVIGDGAGTALWLRPDAPVDNESLGELTAATVDGHRLDAVFGLLELMDQHHPDGPLWYLPFIGVDPAHQGRGHGSAMLVRGLARADHDGLPAYLEASSPRNRALYERHGFAVVGEIRSGDSPPMWPMLRTPR